MKFLLACFLFISTIVPLARAQDEMDNLYIRGNAAQEAGRFDEAAQCWTEVLKLNPKDAQAYYNRANAYKGTKDWEKAFADVEEGLKLTPKDASLYDMRASIYYAQFNAATGEAYTKRDWIKKTIAAYEEGLKVNLEGREKPLEWLLGELDQGHVTGPQAVVYWRAVVKSDPKDADTWMKAGEAEENVLNRAGALADYGEAIRLSPDKIEGYEGRLRIYQRLKRKDDGPRLVADCTEIIRLKPSADIYRTRGGMYRDMRQHDKALADFDELLKLMPGKVDGYEGRASTYEHMEDWDKAIVEYGEILKINPKSWSLQERARAYMKKKDYNHAIEDYNKYIETTPQAVIGQLWRAEAYAAKGDYEKAVADYTTGMNAKNATAFYFAARFYATCADPKYRDPAKAMALQTQACELAHWGDRTYLDAMARIEADAGVWDKAVEHEKMALKLAEAAKKHGVDIDNAYDCEVNWWQIEEDEKEIASFSARLALFEQQKPYVEEKKETP